ncbi:MAG: phosphohexomutase domain-containing protein [Planctomycetota bacterium]|jgi:phosphoglucosamine mutase
MTKKLFGTDGIRAVAGEGPLTPSSVLATGRALGSVLGGPGKKALICRDTRRSGPVIQDDLTRGLNSFGVDVIDAGVRPTPALPYLAKAWDCAFGAVISASHNPMEYNGIKVFGAAGGKISDPFEAKIESAVARGVRAEKGVPPGRALPAPEGPDPYRTALVKTGRALGIRGDETVVVDCANGATFLDAPAVLKALGLKVISINAEPDGQNINAGCGALHPDCLADEVRSHGAGVGVALDGDGDRAIFTDAEGNVRDGDFVLAALAHHFQKLGKLSGSGVVGTVMSNIGLEVSLNAVGISLHRTAVGDRNVAAKMIERSLALGGEPSGHVIFAGPDGLLPGDGILTALHVIAASVTSGISVSDLAGEWFVFPQTLINVPLTDKPPFETVEGLSQRLAEIEKEMGREGRVVLRYSGTEPLARVMVEGRDSARVENYARELAVILEKAVGR